MTKHRLKHRRRILAASAAAVVVGVFVVARIPSGAATVDPIGSNAVYEYLGWGNAQDPVAVMNATGIKQFTLSFVLAGSGCEPVWDQGRPLKGGDDETKINAIRGAGGDVVVSFGGWDGSKLGEKCGTAADLAGAYQKVIDAYQLKAVDIDIENTEMSSPDVRQRVIDALKTVKGANAGLREFVTLGTDPTGPASDGVDLIKKGAAAGLEVDGWTVMPFDFNGHSGSMADASESAVQGLQKALVAAYNYNDDQAWRHTGISSMNGKTDAKDEQVSVTDFQTLRDFATSHHLARFTFWSVNRDRACDSGNTDSSDCSGITQSEYDFTKVVAGFHADAAGSSTPPPSDSASASASGTSSASPSAGASTPATCTAPGSECQSSTPTAPTHRDSGTPQPAAATTAGGGSSEKKDSGSLAFTGGGDSTGLIVAAAGGLLLAGGAFGLMGARRRAANGVGGDN